MDSMALKDIFKINRKTFFAPGDWLGYNILRSQSVYIWTVIKIILGPFFALPTAKHAETFEEAVKRLSLTEEDIKSSENLYWFYAAGFGIIGLGITILAIIFLLQGAFLGFLLALAVASLVLSQAFRYHFWYFQIKHHKLGCTFEEWRAGRIRNKGDPQ
jgi:intracellular multiplication protein IcmV